MTGLKKLKAGTIYTHRYTPDRNHASWHLVYEWEDQLSLAADLSITDSRVARRRRENVVLRNLLRIPTIHRAVGVYDSLLTSGVKSLYFTMSPAREGSFSTRSDVIPIIIDFWKVHLKSFYRAYNNCRLILISSREVFNFLKANACPLNIQHFPLSLPDKYKALPHHKFDKKYDVLIAGRSNPVLMEFMRRYERDHQRVEYLYQDTNPSNGECHYISNKVGVLRGFEGRDAYVNLLRASRVGFYSTPGIDGGEKKTGGFNPVTPRFFELLSAGCHVIARYPRNDDTDFFRLNEICPSIDSYEAFSARLDAALDSQPPMERNSEYLKDHYTSSRITLLNELMHHHP